MEFTRTSNGFTSYEQSECDGRVENEGVLKIKDINQDGYRGILGVAVAPIEESATWSEVFKDLFDRQLDLNSVHYMVSDERHGLKATLHRYFPGASWQRYQFHLQQNASQVVPRQSMNREVAVEFRAIFNALDRTQAEATLARTVEKYNHSTSQLVARLEANLPNGLTVLAFPEAHRHIIRTTIRAVTGKSGNPGSNQSCSDLRQ